MVFLKTLIKKGIFSRIFGRLSTVKVDNFEKIANIIIISLSKVVKIWSEQN